MDTVELAMRIEEEFALVIPERVGETIETVGDIQTFVIKTLEARGEAVDPNDVWRRVVAIVADQAGVDPQTLAPHTHIVYDLGLD